MNDKTKIDGIYFSREEENAWVVKIDGEFYLAPTHPITRQSLKKVDYLDESKMRRVGVNVEKLLLNNGDVEVKKEVDKNKEQKMNVPCKGKAR